MDTLANRFDTVMDVSESTLSDILRARWSKSTIESYRKDWKRFAQWAVNNHVYEYPVHENTMVNYLVWMHEQHFAKSTIRRTVTVVRMLHNASNDPTLARSVTEVMRGIARKDRREPGKAHPLSIADLMAICDALTAKNSAYEYWRIPRDIALLTLGWCGALRASEIVALNWNDITEAQQGFELTIRKSKTSDESEILGIPLLKDTYQSICPVRSLRLWKNNCELLNLQLPTISSNRRTGIPANGDLPIFVNLYGNRLCQKTVGRILDVSAKKAKLNLHLSSHSLRRGFATFAAHSGISERSLMRHGRWHTSSIMQGYIERAAIWNDNPIVQLLT
jgi:site-specific recombinase XerD